MSYYKYYDTSKIKKLGFAKKIKARIYNNKFYIQQNKKYGYLLSINGHPLDDIQKKVVYSEERHTMVIAGAGAGKSTTMIGKIKYLITAKKINPADIIAISFTNESVNNLKKALEKNNVYNINVLTFHKLSLMFIKNPKIIESSYLSYIIKEYFYMNEYTPKKKLILKAFNLTNYNVFLSKIDYYCKDVNKIINLCHSSNYDLAKFLKVQKKIHNKAFWKKASLLSYLYMIIDIYYLYQDEKKATNTIDFDDIIIKAAENIKYYNLRYKYIIVDEYQDTSLIRVNLLKIIIEHSHANLLVVGDDYQSIYGFNGCDLNIFLNFKKYFPNAKIFKLQNTYRNSQELIKISQDFIMKNPYQIKKKLLSKKKLSNPIIIFYYKNNEKEAYLKLLINYVEVYYGNYLILGRNNFDLSNITSIKLNYLTIHKSKGLEADNIILINLENNEYGFPNKLKTNDLEKILFNKRKYTYDEERRLFYVALTRTKNYVFLFVNKDNPSQFIKEIINCKNVKIIKIKKQSQK